MRRRAGRQGRWTGPVPTTSASSSAPFQKLTEIDEAPATTCWFVTMWPFSSTTNPEPCAVFCEPPKPEPPRAAISTTAFDALS